MRSEALIARSGLEHLTGERRYGKSDCNTGLSLSLRTGLALASVVARKGSAPALAVCVREAFAIDLPVMPRRAAEGPLAFAWCGPERWLAVMENEDGPTLEFRLRSAFRDLACVSDQSDGRLVLRIAGRSARDVLAKAVPIDFHPRSFAPGSTALTLAGHISVQIWQIDDAPTYDVVVLRSYAADLWQWLVAAGSEFGVATGCESRTLTTCRSDFRA